jgi:hypothetical protein
MDYETRFRVWFQGLPMKVQAELERLGAGLGTMRDPSIGGNRELDEQTIDTDEHSQAGLIKKAILEYSKESAKEFKEDIQTSQMIRIIHFFMEVMESAHKNDSAMLHAQVVRIVLGLGEPPAQRELSRQLGVPRSTINKRVKRLQSVLGLPPSKFMFHDKACNAFRIGHTLAFLKKKADE